MFDLAIIGSGFGGSLLAMIARRLGRTVLLVEKDVHPRFAIGESSTPLADLLWLELTRRYDLPALAPFAKWGTWRRTHPEVSCGLKRGFTFYHHSLGRPFAAAPDRSDQLIVAASPRDEIADTHWYRSEFDHFLVREAIRHGVEFHDECLVNEVSFAAEGARIQALHRGSAVAFRARFVVDAGAHCGPLARSAALARLPFPHLPPAQALFTHFHGVARLDGLPIHDNVHAAPYSVDDAAVHHVFDGGWIWVLRFSNGLTSAGVAAVDRVAQRLRFDEGAPAWERLLDELPTVESQFRDSRIERPFVHARRVSFRLESKAASAWALLPSAAGFVDPLLSSGFTLNLLGIERLAHALEKAWSRPDAWSRALQRHAAESEANLLAVEHYVAALYSRMDDFSAFTEVARLYFCAVIFCETARRLGRPEISGGLLMREHPRFGPAARELCDAALRGTPGAELRRRVDSVLSEFDLGGLSDGSRRPWYPVRAEDLRCGRERIGASSAEIEDLLAKAGFER